MQLSHLSQASYWIAKADVKGGSPPASDCLSNALEDVNACFAALDSIAADEELSPFTRKCKTLGIIKWVHIKIQLSTFVNNSLLTEDDLSAVFKQLNFARSIDPFNEQIDIMEAECLNSAGKFDDAVEVCEKAVSRAMTRSKRGDSAALVIMSSSKVLFNLNNFRYAVIFDLDSAIDAADADGAHVR